MLAGSCEEESACSTMWLNNTASGQAWACTPARPRFLHYSNSLRAAKGLSLLGSLTNRSLQDFAVRGALDGRLHAMN
jgi:hypothetical protein